MATTTTTTTTNDMSAQATSGVIPHWLKLKLNEKDLLRIRSSVMQAEKKTSGEIVPMVVRSSSSFGHVGLVLFLIGLVFFWTLATQVAHEVPTLPFWILEMSAVVLSMLLAWAFQSTDFAKYYLTSPHDQALSVMHRAQLEFYQSNIKASHRQTGVLIFVSLLERRAVILADETVSLKVPEQEWTNAINLLLKETKQGELARGICDAIALVGQRLSESLPMHIGDRDELSNDLIMKD